MGSWAHKAHLWAWGSKASQSCPIPKKSQCSTNREKKGAVCYDKKAQSQWITACHTQSPAGKEPNASDLDSKHPKS